MSSFQPSRRCCLSAAALLAAGVRPEERPESIPSKNRMLDATWKILSKQPLRPGFSAPEFLPDGTRIRLQVRGPSTRAIEQDIANELVVQFAVVSPVTPELCRTGLGEVTTFGGNICDMDGQPLHSPNGKPPYLEGLATFHRLDTKTQLDEFDDSFFVAQGAPQGAGLMVISLKDKGITWTLWLKSLTEMVSRIILQGPHKRDLDELAQVWQREA